MSEREWRRLDVVRRVEAGQLTNGEAAQVLGLSVRQVRRLRRAVEQRGTEGMVHGNRGRRSQRKTADDVSERVVELRRTKYVRFNDVHFTEKLAKYEGIELGRSTVRRILRAAGEGPARKRRATRHRRRRERKAQAGLMVLWDGSRHDWLEGRGPMLCLMAAIDDATSELLPGAHFVEQECAAGYLRVLREIVRQRGIPASAYGDQHGALKRNDDHWTLAEELRGEQDLTQVGRALRTLGVEQIHALSPQAKGRVERLWGTLQDRLGSELRLARACTLQQAQGVLDGFVAEHNERFAVAAVEAATAWRTLPRHLDLDRICAFRYEATVGNDNCVRLQGRVLDIPPGPGERGYAKARVEVLQLLDGSWRIYRADELIATQDASGQVELRALKRRKRSAADRAFGRAARRLAAL